jgi:hypothetical protein
MKDKIVPIAIAVVILLVGVLLLVMNLMDVPLTFDKMWPAIPIVIGLMMLLKIKTDYSVVFPATILIGVGTIFYIDNLQLLGAGINMGQLWPLFPIVVGLAFVALYAFKPGDWGVLIPAAACLITGSVFMSMQQMKNVMVFIIAPVIIIVGLLMIVTSIRKPNQISGAKNDGKCE